MEGHFRGIRIGFKFTPKLSQLLSGLLPKILFLVFKLFFFCLRVSLLDVQVPLGGVNTQKSSYKLKI